MLRSDFPLVGQDESPAPMPTFAERKAAREAARKEAERALRERIEGRQVVSQHFLDWMNGQTECDWCGTVEARHEFAELDRDEAGLEKDNDDGLYNSCEKCADARDKEIAQRCLEDDITNGVYDDYDPNVSLLTDEDFH